MLEVTDDNYEQEESSIECFRCGICCMLYRPKVSREEIERIAQELSMSKKEFVSKYVRTIPEKGISILQNNAEHCPFLSMENETQKATCIIHHFRPNACKNWQAGLSRPECREGLNKLNPKETILLPQDMYSVTEEMRHLFSALSDNSE